MSNSIACVVCGTKLKDQPAATRILWKLYTCHAKSCATVFRSLSHEEQEYIDHDVRGDYYLKTKSYIAAQNKNDFADYYYEGDERYLIQEDFKERNGFGIDDLFKSYKTFIEDNNEIGEYEYNGQRYRYITFDISYQIYFPPDLSRMKFLGEQYKKIYRLKLSVSSLAKAARNIGEQNFGLCPPCNLSIIRTNYFKQFHI